MKDSLSRIAAIVRADFLVRFRRPSTVVVFLLLSACSYFWVPAPSTGKALIQINGHRALMNSGAIGMGTASLGMIFVGLFGFYVISNSIRRDVVSRCGMVAASTPMRSSEYLVGKFLGNLVFLFTFLAGFMLASMLMLLVRGEAPLEPLVFIGQYLLLTPAAIVFVSAVAVLFESISWLAGKLGDVLYFFLFMASISVVVTDLASHGGFPVGRYFDFSGFGFMIDQMQRTLHTESVSIGSSSFDPTKTPIIFNGLTMTREWLAPRMGAILLPLLLLPVATLFFHRFDPVRTKATSDRGRRNWIGRVQMLLKPLSRRVVGAMMRPARGHSLGASIWADAVLTLTLFPLALLAFVAVGIATLSAAPPPDVLPAVFLALGVIVSDTVTRDVRAATRPIIYAAPRLREHLVWWKLGSTCVLALLFFAIPLVRAANTGGFAFAMLAVGVIFVAAAATALGVITGNPKAFLVGFLSFWYVVVNERGALPLFDFAGFYGAATRQTLFLYAGLTLAAVAAAEVAHRWRLARA
ncbi:MAG: hypothetical protein M3Y80_01400 [Verrucomicrobiota bacterium]|nr:hypothetical protein [Verrucomicrobiota bacterium]